MNFLWQFAQVLDNDGLLQDRRGGTVGGVAASNRKRNRGNPDSPAHWS